MKKQVVSLIAALVFFASSAFSAEVEKKQHEPFKDYVLSKAKEYVEKGESTVSKVVAVIEKEAPELAAEVVRRGIASGAILAFIGAILISMVLPFFLSGYRKWHKDGDPALGALSIMAHIALSSTGLVLFFVAIYDLVTILVAPRLYLLEQIANILK